MFLDQLRHLAVIDALPLGLVGEVLHRRVMIGEHEAVGVELEAVAQRPAVADGHLVLLVLRRDFLVLHLRPVDVAHRRHAGVDDVVHLGADGVGRWPFGDELHGDAPAVGFRSRSYRLSRVFASGGCDQSTLRPANLHHLAPFLGFRRNELAKSAGEPDNGSLPMLASRAANCGIGKHRIHVLVEPVDRRRAACPWARRCRASRSPRSPAPFRRWPARPAGPWRASRIVTPSARSLPSLTCDIDEGSASNMTCTSPVISAVSAAGMPRYGT